MYVVSMVLADAGATKVPAVAIAPLKTARLEIEFIVFLSKSDTKYEKVRGLVISTKPPTLDTQGRFSEQQLCAVQNSRGLSGLHVLPQVAERLHHRWAAESEHGPEVGSDEDEDKQ